jgi:Gas vesicle synthesis protein GvpL/GvpF
MESLASPAADTLLYLYGFVRASAPMAPIAGIEPDSAVFLVADGDVACAASCVPGRVYQTPESRVAPRSEWVTRRAIRHHEVIQALHAAGGVLPMKFGSLCQTRDDLRDMVAELRPTIGELLDRFAGKDEWTLKTTVDAEAIGGRIERESAQVIALQECIAALPEGRAYFVRKQRARLVTTLTSQRLAALEDAIGDRLAGVGIPLVRLRRAPESPAAALTDAGLLVDPGGLERLKETLIDLQVEHAACGVGFTLVGPWPPYSFVPALGSGN